MTWCKIPSHLYCSLLVKLARFVVLKRKKSRSNALKIDLHTHWRVGLVEICGSERLGYMDLAEGVG